MQCVEESLLEIDSSLKRYEEEKEQSSSSPERLIYRMRKEVIDEVMKRKDIPCPKFLDSQTHAKRAQIVKSVESLLEENKKYIQTFEGHIRPIQEQIMVFHETQAHIGLQKNIAEFFKDEEERKLLVDLVMQHRDIKDDKCYSEDIKAFMCSVDAAFVEHMQAFRGELKQLCEQYIPFLQQYKRKERCPLLDCWLADFRTEYALTQFDAPDDLYINTYRRIVAKVQDHLTHKVA